MTTTQNPRSEAPSTYGAEEIGTTVHVSPASLLMARNIREAKPSKALIDSVRDKGVLVPITAVLTEDGNLLVRYGHRRTLAAIEAARDSVPVYISDQDSLDKQAEVERVISQRDENTHRDGLSTADEVGVVETLTGLGLSPAQIAKQARIKRVDVDAALVVSGNELARKATDRYDNLTIDQALVVAEFSDDAETVKALIVASTTGEFDHVAQRARDDRAEVQYRESLLASLAEADVTVVDTPGYEDKTTRRVSGLRVSAEDRTPLDETDHTGCPGHVAWLGSDWVTIDATGAVLVLPERPTIEEPDAPYDPEEYEDYLAAVEEGEEGLTDPRAGIDPAALAEYEEALAAYEAEWATYQQQAAEAKAGSRREWLPVAVYGCQGWSKNGHVDRYGSTSTNKPKASEMSEEEREKAKAERKLVIENNKAWAAAQPVRREWLATFAKSKTAPKGTAAFLATAFSTDSHAFTSVGGNHLAAEWLGKKAGQYGHADLSPAKSTTEARALVLLLVMALAGYESDLGDNAWRQNGTTSSAGRYLRFLASAGYPLSAVEKFAISTKTA